MPAPEEWQPPQSQAAAPPPNPRGIVRPEPKGYDERYLRARAKTWEVGAPVYDAPYPDAFVPALTAVKRPLKSRAAFSLPAPMWAAPQHTPSNDAVFALAVKYRIIDYVRFVGTLRRTGFSGDIVLAVSPDMGTQCKECRKYLQAMDVIAYPVAFNCSKVCAIKDTKISPVYAHASLCTYTEIISL